MAYAFNSIQNLLDQEKDGQGSIFGGGSEQAGDGGQMQTGASGAGGGAIGGGSGGGTSAPSAKAAPVSNTVEAFSAQADKNKTTGAAQAKYIEPSAGKIQQGLGDIQKEADSYAAGAKKAATGLSQEEIGSSLKSGDFKNIQGYLNPALANNEFGASQESKKKLGEAQSEIDALGTSAGLGEKVLKAEGGGEFSRRLSKGVASNVLGGDAYKAALADAKAKASAVAGQVGGIEDKATQAARGNVAGSQAEQRKAAEDALNLYKSNLQAGAQGRAGTALTGIGGEGFNQWNAAQQQAAYKEFLQGLSPQEAALAKQIDGAKFGQVNRPQNLTWQQFVSPEDYNQMGQIDTLLNRQPVETYSAQYGGPEQYYGFDKAGYQSALRGQLTKNQSAQWDAQRNAQPVIASGGGGGTGGGLNIGVNPYGYGPSTGPVTLDTKKGVFAPGSLNIGF